LPAFICKNIGNLCGKKGKNSSAAPFCLSCGFLSQNKGMQVIPVNYVRKKQILLYCCNYFTNMGQQASVKQLNESGRAGIVTGESNRHQSKIL